MLHRSLVFLAFLGLSTAFVIEGLRRRRSAHYHGPLAQLNQDGTVALTPEVQQARAAHEAAIAAEYKRLEEAKRLAAAHPDLTSPPDHGWNHHQGYHAGFTDTQVSSQDKGHQMFSTSGHHLQTHMPAPLNKDGTVALTLELQKAKAAHDAAFDAALKRLMEAQAMAHLTHQDHPEEHHNQGSHGSLHSKNPEAGMPAPLNPDGTVAQTAAYNAIASSHNAEYEKVLHNIKHQHAQPHFQHQTAKGYSY